MTIHKTMLPLAAGLALLLLSAVADAQPAERTIAQPAGQTIGWYRARSPFPMPGVIRPSFPDKNFRLTDYGATGDGHTLNTNAFHNAIQACAAAGGGHVVVPAGRWLTGPIELQSHVDLHLEAGAEVLFTPDHTQYAILQGQGHGILVASPIYGFDLEDVGITGQGFFDGAGDTWRPVKKSKQTAAQWESLLASGGVLSSDGQIWWPSREARDGEAYLRQLKQTHPHPSPEDYLPARDWLRPYMVYLAGCRRILIEGVTLRNSPKFVFCPNHCTDLTMERAHIFNDWWAQNGDGIDISACRNVVIYRCTVNAGDDGICMKASGGGSGGPVLENILIAEDTVYRAHGGFVIGSNTDGGAEHIFVSNCFFDGTDVGLRFKSNKGRGGLVRDIFVQDITMRDIVREAVLFDTYYEDAPAGSAKDANKPASTDKIPEFRDFHISRVSCLGAQTAIAITGLPEQPVHDIYFDSVAIRATKGLVATQARNIDLHAVRLDVAERPVMRTDKTADIRVR